MGSSIATSVAAGFAVSVAVSWSLHGGEGSGTAQRVAVTVAFAWIGAVSYRAFRLGGPISRRRAP